MVLSYKIVFSPKNVLLKQSDSSGVVRYFGYLLGQVIAMDLVPWISASLDEVSVVCIFHVQSAWHSRNMFRSFYFNFQYTTLMLMVCFRFMVIFSGLENKP